MLSCIVGSKVYTLLVPPQNTQTQNAKAQSTQAQNTQSPKIPKAKILKVQNPKKIEMAIPIKKLTASWTKSFRTPLIV